MQHQPRVHEHVAFGMKLFRLQHTFHCIELRENRAHKVTGVQQVPPAHPIGRHKNANQLIADSFRADLVD